MGIAKGLEGIEVDETAISLVDGERGTLSYRGRSVDALVAWPFARVVWLVLTGEDPDPGTLAEFTKELAANSALTAADVALIDRLADRSDVHPMQALVALATTFEHRPGAFARFGEAARGLTIAARAPAAIARLLSLRRGDSPAVVAHDDLDPIRRFLRAIGTPDDDRLRHAFEVTQILQVEHGFNASTFAARVVASTLAPVENAIAGAFATLHGRLHGGADQAALETALHVGSAGAAAPFVDDCLARGIKVMGMGHREYRVLDPRARYVKRFALELSRGTDLEPVATTLEAIESQFNARMRERGKALHANLEFYKGIVYSAAGLPPDFFTAAFGLARVYGYVAHFIESRRDNRIIRPSARYVGVMPEAAA
jgi:citrate synthase